MDANLKTLIDLQGHDARVATLESEAARLPLEIEAIEKALADAKKTLDTLKTRQDQTRKDLRAKEKDLEVINTKRVKTEGRLYEVKTNKEYSAVLLEIEEIKQEKGEVEEQILTLMETQERVALDIREAEKVHGGRETEARRDVGAVKEKLAEVEKNLGEARDQRNTRAQEVPAALLTDYDRIRKGRGGIAVTHVGLAAVCGGCRMTIRPQAIQEIRAAATLMKCENCGRFLYWQE